MNTLIIYDSEFGNTEQIARKIAETLQTHGTVQLILANQVETVSLQGVDLLIAGCPTQRHSFSPAMRALLEDTPRGAMDNIAGAAFDTRYHMAHLISGSAARLIAKRLERAGAEVLVEPESFFVVEREGPLEDGELERAGQWAATVFEKFEASRAARK